MTVYHAVKKAEKTIYNKMKIVTKGKETIYEGFIVDYFKNNLYAFWDRAIVDYIFWKDGYVIIMLE